MHPLRPCHPRAFSGTRLKLLLLVLAVATGRAWAREIEPEQVPKAVWRVFASLQDSPLPEANDRLRSGAEREEEEERTARANNVFASETPSPARDKYKQIGDVTDAATLARKIDLFRETVWAERYSFPKHGRTFYLLGIGVNRNSTVYVICRTKGTTALVPVMVDGEREESFSASTWSISFRPGRGIVLNAWEKYGPSGAAARYVYRGGKFVRTFWQEQHIDGTPIREQ